MSNRRILLVEDEPAIAKVISDCLRSEGYAVTIACDGPGGLARALADKPDLIILDLMLPGISGLEVCRNIRLVGYNGGILMVTALGDVEHRIKGLKSGADDYLPKPVNMGELLVRIEVLLRRMAVSGAMRADPKIEIADIVLDFSSSTFSKCGEAFHLTTKELELLRLLVENRQEVVSRDEILAKVWKENVFVSPRTVDVHVSWLRQKIEANPERPRLIMTIRGEGYKFNG